MLGAELGIGFGDFGQVVVEDALLAVQGAHLQAAADADLLFVADIHQDFFTVRVELV